MYQFDCGGRTPGRVALADHGCTASEFRALKDDTFSISALHLAIKVPYFSNSGHKNEKATPLTAIYLVRLRLGEHFRQVLRAAPMPIRLSNQMERCKP
eukprot:SAG31_NODE_569_length_14020_cov_11.049565_16_plen_98_part_00